MNSNNSKLFNLRFKNVYPLHLEKDLEAALKKSYQSLVSVGQEPKWKMLVLIFAQPKNQIAEESIIPQLSFFHYDTQNVIDLFCVGYYDLSREKELPTKEIIKVGDDDWGYSVLHFIKMKNFFQQETEWRYSGGAEMIITNFMLHEDRIIIEYNTAITIALEEAIKCGAIVSTESFIIDMINFIRGYEGNDPTFDFSKYKFGELFKKTFWSYLISFLPEWLRATPKQANTFLAVDIRKRKKLTN
jgi:hypothetical protein